MGREISPLFFKLFVTGDLAVNPYKSLSFFQEKAFGIFAFFLVLVIWVGLTQSGIVPETKLPSPLQVAHAFSYLAWSDGHSMLLTATLASLSRLIKATIFIILIGVPIGILMGSSQKINSFLSPIVDPLRSTPVTALIPLFVIWFGIGEEMKVIFLISCAIVFVIPLVRDAMLAVPYQYWEGMADLGGNSFECIWKGILPIAAPRIFDAIIVAISIEWTYLPASEYVNADSGLGQMIQNSKRFSATDQVIAGILTIIAMALVTYLVLTFIKKKLYHWEGK